MRVRALRLRGPPPCVHCARCGACKPHWQLVVADAGQFFEAASARQLDEAMAFVLKRASSRADGDTIT
eukprot:6343686-Lingulodinium_polyedra.AAC.1